MKLYQRIRLIAEHVAGSQTKMAKTLGMPPSNFNYYLSEEKENNLWIYLPKILEEYPHISKYWLYLGEGEMLESAEMPSLTQEQITRTNEYNPLGVGKGSLVEEILRLNHDIRTLTQELRDKDQEIVALRTQLDQKDETGSGHHQ